MPNKRHKSITPSSRQLPQKRRGDHRRGLSGWWIGLGLVVIVAAAYLLLRPKSALPSEIEATQAYEMYQKGAVFVDVRTQAEWDQGHIAQSILIPLDELQNRLNELPQDKDIVVVCRSGARSKEGATILRQAGFTRVTCMNGGIQAWVAAGYPITN
jgi:rhodanese-related sulfurtransferase